VLDRNLFDSPPLAIHEAKVDLTMVAGRVAYSRLGEASDKSAQRGAH
jgi:predicted amidohydrolase YtcJ